MVSSAVCRTSLFILPNVGFTVSLMIMLLSYLNDVSHWDSMVECIAVMYFSYVILLTLFAGYLIYKIELRMDNYSAA